MFQSWYQCDEKLKDKTLTSWNNTINYQKQNTIWPLTIDGDGKGRHILLWLFFFFFFLFCKLWTWWFLLFNRTCYVFGFSSSKFSMVSLCLCCDFDGHQSRRRSCNKDNKRWKNSKLEGKISTLNLVVVHVW